MTEEVRKSLSQARLRFNAKSPFFAVLIGNLHIEQVSDDHEIQTAATDGSSLYINGPYWMKSTAAERDFILAHEVLHIAFLHISRRGNRQPERWNAAGDFAINLQLQGLGFTLPQGVLIDHKYDRMTADEIYDLLPSEKCTCCHGMIGDGQPTEADIAWWKGVLERAKHADRMYGNNAVGVYLKFGEFQPTIDWRKELWNIMGNSTDFSNFDRRLVHESTYVEELVNRSDTKGMCAICIDTSGSVMNVLGKFIAEVKEIVDLYQIEVPLYWADYDLIGPLDIEEIDRPRGGGGTSFVPFFEEVKRKEYERVVYFSDLDGEYPCGTDADVLWVVPTGTVKIPPFGRVVKIMKGDDK